MKKEEINLLNLDRIKKNLRSFEKDRHPLERYASFDYCFNYFQEKYKNGEIKTIVKDSKNIQLSCLQLGFYLASWGMYRGSTFLLQKSVKIFEPLIQYVASDECDVWSIDVNEYTDDNIEKLIKCGKRIEKELGMHKTKKAGVDKIKKATDTLITKIMLGVFGNMPAFDGYFRSGSNLGTFNKHSLKEISSFYDKYEKIISDEATRIKTFEYPSGEAGSRSYTKAKIVDMIFFIEGYENDKSL